MSVTAAKGFEAAGAAVGIKVSGAADLAVVATADRFPVSAAGVFTSNLMTAAPVQVSQAHLATTAGKAVAVVLNSGNANAATGAAGRAVAEATAAAVSEVLGCSSSEVLVCSTGLIGIDMPQVVINGAASVASQVAAGDEAGHAAARAIMTTDTRPKESVAVRGEVIVGGMAKGAAMLAPSMATMLAVLTTDADVSAELLQRSLRNAVDCSFNRLLTDGCTSTNDTVLVLASGRAGPISEPDLTDALTEVCQSLAEQMANDAEGATKVVKLTVQGARDDHEARIGADRIARSLLCKCSWYGQDPYWGRLASELGSAGIDFEQTSISVSYGGIVVAAEGINVAHDHDEVARHMAQRQLDIVCDIGLGDGSATVLTNDLTHAYVDENMGGS